jgi:hypothetical protein
MNVWAGRDERVIGSQLSTTNSGRTFDTKLSDRGGGLGVVYWNQFSIYE